MIFCNFLQSLHCNVGTNLKINVLHLWVGVRIFFHWTKASYRISSVEKCFCENFLSFRCGHYGGLVLYPPPCYSFPSFGRVVNTHGWIFSVLYFYNHCTIIRFSHGHWMAKDSCRHFSHQTSLDFLVRNLNNAHKSPWWGIPMTLLIATDLLGFRFCHHNKHFEGASCSLPPFWLQWFGLSCISAQNTLFI